MKKPNDKGTMKIEHFALNKCNGGDDNNSGKRNRNNNRYILIQMIISLVYSARTHENQLKCTNVQCNENTQKPIQTQTLYHALYRSNHRRANDIRYGLAREQL